jgi:hypothetical protein
MSFGDTSEAASALRAAAIAPSESEYPASHQRRSTMPVSASSCPAGMRSRW